MLNRALMILLAAGTAWAQCGVERWSVKTGTDPDAGLVNTSVSTSTTIANMRALTAPSTLPANNRVQPTEITVFTINATLTEYKLETDSDYHIVIADASGNTMITEIPAPGCVGAGSPFATAISNSRSKFDAQLHATTSFQTANIPVQIKGVGFFDFLHGDRKSRRRTPVTSGYLVCRLLLEKKKSHGSPRLTSRPKYRISQRAPPLAGQ